MLYALQYILFSMGLLYSLWIFYLAVMNLKRVNDTTGLNTICKILGAPVLLVGFLIDFLSNVLVMTILLIELPQEFTVTARLKRHKRKSQGWRLKIVEWFEQTVDSFDPSGNHV